MQVLITGSAGFIGYHLAKALARQGIATYGIDSINSYYPKIRNYHPIHD
ncbi:NAD-dependent epimerase/dehydratase family protein [Odoribacter splanchnicus]